MSTDPTRTDAPSGASGDGAAPRGLGGEVRPDGTGADRPPGFEERVRSRRSRWLRRAGFAVLALVGTLVLVVGAAYLYLQSSGGQGRLRGVVVGQIEQLLADDAVVTAEALEGNFFTGARLVGLKIVRDSEVVLAVDTVLVEYRLRTLLNRTFSAERLYIGGPSLFVRQRADSTFNVAGLLKPAEDTTKVGTFTVLVDDAALRRGRVEVHWLAPDADSVLVVSGLTARVSDVASTPDSLVGSLDGLRLVATAPLDAARLALSGSGRFTKERLALREIELESEAGTQVRGSALAVFGEAAGGALLPVFEADLEATPLALSDVRAFTGASLYGSPRARIRADSDGETLGFTLNAALDDATATLEGALTRNTRGPVRYRADGALRNLNPGALTGNPNLDGDLSGELSANLQGQTLQTLSGPFSVLVRESRFGAQAIDRVRLDGSFAAGQVRFDLDGDVPGASLAARGSARPFGAVPSFQVTGTARELDLGRLLPNSGQTARIAGDFAVVGRGNSLDTFTGTAAVSLGQAAFAAGETTVRLASADLDADIRNGVVDFDADAVLAGGGGRVTAVGGADLGSDPLRYRVTRGTMTRLNVAALTGNPDQESNLTGTFTVDGRGVDPQTARIDLDASLRDSRFGTYDLVAVDADATLDRGRLRFDTEADLGRAGFVAAAGTARPFSDPIAYTVEGRLRNLDLAELTGDPSRFSDLTGTFTADGRGVDPNTLTLDANVTLDGSSYGDRYVDRADLDIRLDRGALAVTGDVDAPGGSIALDVTGRLGEDLALNLGENTCFTNLDVGAFTGNADLDTSLNGCFTGSLRGLGDLPTADGSGALTLRPSTVNEAEIEGGRVAFTLADGALGATADLTLGDPTGEGAAGSFVGAVQARPFADVPTYAVRGAARDLDLAALTGAAGEDPARLTLDFNVSGRGTDPRTMTLDGRLTGGSSVVGPVRVDSLSLAFALADGVLAVDTLALDTDIATLEGGGTLALFDSRAGSAFRLSGEIETLDPLNVYTEQTIGLQSGRLDLIISADAGNPTLRVSGVVEARQLIVGENAVTGLDATLFAQIDRALVDSLGVAEAGLDAFAGRTQLSFDVLSTPSLRVDRGAVELTAVDGEIRAEGGVTIDARRDLDFATRFEIGADPRRVAIERGRFSVDGDTWTLGQEATITLGDEIDVRGLILTSDAGNQQIAADGTIDFDGEQNLIVTVEGVEIGTVADLFQYENLGGTLSASLVLSGPAAAPLLDGSIRLDDLASSGQTFGALDATLAYASDRLDIDAVLTHVDGEELTIEGFVPIQFSLADSARTETAESDEGVQFVARSAAFPIDWAQPFLADRGYTELGGTLALDLTVTGTQGAPSLDGTARLTDGRLGLVTTGLTYAPLLADLRFAGNQILLDDVRILDESRTALDVTGDITLRELSLGELDLTIQPTRFVALDTPVYGNLTLDSGRQPLRLTGTLQAPVLRGGVTVAAGDIYADKLVPVEFEDVTLTDAQIREVEARFGRRVTARDTTVNRFVDALDYDLTVGFNRNVWIRSESGLTPYDIEFEGEVQATKRPFAEESQLFGQIDLVRGVVQAFSDRFTIDSGTLVFNGPALGVLIDLQASSDIRLSGASAAAANGTVTVVLRVTGRFDENPQITLTSTPPLDPADIASLITTGRLADDFGGGGGAIGSTLLGAGFGQVSGALQGLAGDNLGLDLVEFDVNPNGEFVLRLGRYLGQRTFVTAAFVNGETSSSRTQDQSPVIFTLEYQLRRWLQAQGEYGGERGIGGGFGAEVAW